MYRYSGILAPSRSSTDGHDRSQFAFESVDDISADIDKQSAAARRCFQVRRELLSRAAKPLKTPAASVREDGAGANHCRTPTRLAQGTSALTSKMIAKERRWKEAEPMLPRNTAAANAPTVPKQSRSSSQQHASSRCNQPAEEEGDHSCANKPLFQEQLVAEVKGVYAGLVMAKAKCIEVDSGKRSDSWAEQRAMAGPDCPPSHTSARAPRFLPGITAPISKPCPSQASPKIRYTG